MTSPTHRMSEPAIHYWGTPVVLVSTVDEAGVVNIAPMSSVWWLGWSAMLGFDATSKTVENLRRNGECVLNLCDADCAVAVNALARTTGSSPVPVHKRLLGYRSVADKAAHAGLSLLPSVEVSVPRIEQCPVHLEARVRNVRPFGATDRRLGGPACAIEVELARTHVREDLLRDADHVDTARWRPLLMSFRDLFSLGPPAAERSRLNHGPEANYAPWKSGPLRRVAAAVIGQAAKRRYGVADGD
ncbi:MAG: flavin reductase family protein [Nannocystaceae bacterium]|nr:flavin reductase family protein [Nannocystaceae bacterium]